MYRNGLRDIVEIAELIEVTEKTAGESVRGAKRDEKAEKQKRAVDMWLDCATQKQISKEIGVPQQTVADWPPNPHD